MSTTKAKRPMRTDELMALLKGRYAGDAWGFLTEVPDGTALMKNRTVDALAMSLWPSRGLVMHGHEVKVSRSDWVKELRTPQKAEHSARRWCHYWWVVVADRSIVRDGELPATWGLMAPAGSRGLVAVVNAPALVPEPLSWPFIASLFRCIQKSNASSDEIANSYDRGKGDGYREGYEQGKQHGLLATHSNAKHLQERIEAFESASGIELGGKWENPKIGRAVRAILAADLGKGDPLDWVRDQLSGLRRKVNGALDALGAPEQPDDDEETGLPAT